ncbi:MAG: hypothetical protein ACI9MS_002509 [Glaciecola sp.]|jgi:hypothetical protein
MRLISRMGITIESMVTPLISSQVMILYYYLLLAKKFRQLRRAAILFCLAIPQSTFDLSTI